MKARRLFFNFGDPLVQVKNQNPKHIQNVVLKQFMKHCVPAKAEGAKRKCVVGKNSIICFKGSSIA